MTDQTPNPADNADDDFDDTDAESMDLPEPPHPVNWNLLSSHDLEQEWLALNRWVDWLRRTYGLPASVIPPYWHHHDELL